MLTKKFKNDKERTDFLDDYRNAENGWILWKEDADLSIRIWRNDLSEDHAYIVEENLVTYGWPQRHQVWAVRDRYIIDWSKTGTDMEKNQKSFRDQRASKTQQLTDLKEFQKK